MRAASVCFENFANQRGGGGFAVCTLFENSRYSLFAIAYKDEAKKQENNGDPSKNDGNSGGSGHSGGSGKSDGDSQTASVATGDTAPIAGMVILVILAAGILVIRRKINRNRQEL